ncbi:hypothetical protein [Desulfococcus multivorans]|uniref:Uncharacterized protein n=1 Tax=Desulfococcus multivorans DSM 2059 TaxID=1121405 RepID=S7V9Z8_DESML|nr:hypothetical protein [Desulfococcus multivorans]AOY59569.1 uncharacterized protein Dmul_27970 [Desulfococcus multivorans]AQV01761.1 hypothetical protein B2D07_13980 [Desulfococcus multivorans]EPR43544.1 hypothetical protein dsmv_1182 [Desulfococcus multivorans DSM 2059]SKA25489.1 hypothetical protein SAMN02745446_03561 [Desulfococcus multivorans DSM 2059]
MGRGLSPLQQRILDLADQADSGTVYAFEVLVDVYGFPLARRGRFAGTHFNRREIGRRYFSGTVAVSRAFNRLANRGLAERIIGGIRVHQDGENRHN